MHRWYSGWRSLLPQDVIDDKAIEAKLREALMMINQRISGPTSNAPPPPMPSQPAPNVNFEVGSGLLPATMPSRFSRLSTIVVLRRLRRRWSRRSKIWSRRKRPITTCSFCLYSIAHSKASRSIALATPISTSTRTFCSCSIMANGCPYGSVTLLAAPCNQRASARCCFRERDCVTIALYTLYLRTLLNVQ